MGKKRKRNAQNKQMSQDFTDALSKREQRRLQQQKLEKQNQLERQEDIAFERMLKQKKELQKKLQQGESHARVKVHKVNLDKQRKSEKSTGTNFVLLFTMLCAFGYLGYSIYIAQNKIDHIYTIINASLITLTITLFAITGMMKKTKKRKIGSILTSLAFIAMISLNIGTSLEFFTLPTQPVVVDLTSKTVNEALKWASENKIELVEVSEFSDTVEENTVMSQSVEPNTLIKDVKTIEIISSNGPNPESKIDLPDMIGWDVDKVVKEIKKHKLTNVVIDFEFSTIERDTLFEQSKSGKIHRNEELKLKFSLGNEEDLLPVELINLSKKDEFDATLWLKRNGIKYEIKYEFSDTIKKGQVISTTPKKGTIINQKEQSVILIISKGPKIIVPDFEKMTLDEIAEWAIKYNINITYSSEYDSKIKKGKIIRISHKKGDVIEENSTLYITTSKGTLRMIDYNENDLTKIRTFANTYKINLVENEEYSDSIEQGKIIRVSHKKGDIINNGDTIEVVISMGSSIEVPDFTGMKLSEAQSLCKSKNLDCTITYIKSNKNKNTVVGQNKRAGSEVIHGTNVVLSVSNGIAPSTGGGSSSNNGGNSSWGGNNGGSNKPTTPTCDQSKGSTVNLQYGNTGSQTQQMILKMNPNHKFTWNMVDSCPNGSTTSGTICSSSIPDGSWANYCTTIQITVVK